MPARTSLFFIALGLLAPAGAAGTGSANEVTIRADLRRSRGLELEGTVASSAAGETVHVLAKDCGPAHHAYRLVAGTTTAGGGVWRVTSQEAGLPLGPSATYFRARWRRHVSRPVLVKFPASVLARWRPRKRVVLVSVATWFSGQSLRRRFVELQRQIEGTDMWVRIRRARLGPRRRSRGLRPGDLFMTQFAIPTRGLTLRVLVPQQTGAPCFSAGVSATWRS
jgi:hypothetical protein